MAGKAQRTRQTNETARKGGPTRPVAQKPVAQVQQADLGTLQRAVVNPRVARPSDILALQRTVGNQTVTRLIQTKLTVGSAGDRYEQEADRVAEQVMAMPAPRSAPSSVQRAAEEEEEVQTRPLAASITPLVQRQEVPEEEEIQTKPLVQRQEAPEEEEVQTKPLVQRQEVPEEEEVQTKPLVQRQEVPEEEEVQTKPLVQRRGDGSFEASPELESHLAAHKGGGSPLPEDVRAYMEPRFGADFGGVRVHTGGEAAQLNRALSAQAFTHGQDIYLGEGRYGPDSDAGKRLLAHELAHTLQQGASKRIAGWWPTGHRLVTELALKQGNLSKLYDPKAQQYLIGRSPDMDFVQDQILTMNEGIELGAARIEMYENLIKAGQTKQAQNMWDNNELHYRKPAYMLSHGEGGLYKQENPAGINEAMTSKLVLKATDTWNWTQEATYGPSLSILSDALHQAEDRGSHGEGRKFTGHDSRLMVQKWAKKHKRPLQSWEKWEGAPPEARTGQWEPDNFSVNKRGAVLGVGFAQGVLEKFANVLVADEQMPVEGPGKSATEKRAMRAKKWMWFQSKSSGLGARLIGKSGKGGTTWGKRSALKKILEQKQALILSGELKEGEYEKAIRAPHRRHETLEKPGAKAALREGFQFYEHGAGFEGEFRAAEAKFRELAKSRFRKGGKKKSERIREAQAYFVSRTSGAKDNPQALAQIAGPIQDAYEQVFHVRLYPEGQTPWDQLNKMGIK
jgi:hypothetical protein